MRESYLGIELGSTRIKAVLIDGNYQILASGSHFWENQLVDGLWTYSLNDVWDGVRNAYSALAACYEESFNESLTTVDCICISAMMHGYLAFDANDLLLTPFRTWRNTNTAAAAAELSSCFGFNIPLRWSVAHLYQAVLDGEQHVNNISYLTTLAGYVHWQLTGERVLGIGDASGMFPLDGFRYNPRMLQIFDELCSGTSFSIYDLLPKILRAGENAGCLTQLGAALLDPNGKLRAGIPFSPPEGDAATGMTATNSVAPRTGNVSAGTSIFAMLILEKPLLGAYPEIDIVATPDGIPAAMVHCNNCTSDLDAWVKLFDEFIAAAGLSLDKSEIYDLFYSSALKRDASCEGLLSYNYFSGEPITGFPEGRPLFVRSPNARFSFPDFSRTLLFSAIATLRIGIDILTTKEHVRLDALTGHGGFFKSPDAAQQLMSAALGLPICLYKSASEGGAWGAALLAAFSASKFCADSLASFLNLRVFVNSGLFKVLPHPADLAAFDSFLIRFMLGLDIERSAVRRLS